MAALTALQWSKVFDEGVAARYALFRIFGITTADTLDLSAFYKKVTVAAWLPTSGASVAAACTAVAGVVTFAPASIANDDGYLIVGGAGVQQ